MRKYAPTSAEEVNWLEISNSDRWVGGINLIGGQPCWMWDENKLICL